MVKGFSNMYNFSIFGQFFFFANIFTIYLNFANFFADSISRAQELSNDVSFVIFGHPTWDLEGGQIDPPQAYPGFQVPQQR